MDRDDRLLRLGLSPLSQLHTVELVRVLVRPGTAGTSVERMGEAVWRTSEGNPFVIVETVRELVETGGAPTGRHAPVPRRVRDLLSARLERLSEPSRRLAAAAAVIGREFSFDLLRRSAGLGARAAAEGLEELVRRRIMSAVGDGFDFTHERVRRVVHEGLLEPRRRTLHAAIGQALEALQMTAPQPMSDRLAYHFEAAGIPDKAVRYLAHLAETARQRYALDEAQRAIDQALVLVDRLSEPEREESRLRLLVGRAGIFAGLGRFRDTLALLLPYRQQVEMLKDPVLVAQYCFRLAFTHAYLSDAEAARVVAAQGLEAAASAGDDAMRGQIHYVLGLLAYWLGRPHDGIHHCTAAVTRLASSGQRFWLGFAHAIRRANYWLHGDLEAALPDLTVAEAIGKETGESRLESTAAFLTGMVLALRGRGDAALAAGRHGQEVARDVVASAQAAGMMGLIHLELGAPEPAVPLLETGAAELERFGYRYTASRFMAGLAEAHVALGKVDRAAAWVDRALAIDDEAPSAWSRGVARRAQARVALARGDLGAAEVLLEEAATALTSVGLPRDVGRLHLLRAEVALARGDRPAARARFAEGRRVLLALDLPAERQHVAVTSRRLAVDEPGPAGPGGAGAIRAP